MSHGERTPSELELEMLGAPPPDHVFSPYGAGAMTNVSILYNLNNEHARRIKYLYVDNCIKIDILRWEPSVSAPKAKPIN